MYNQKCVMLTRHVHFPNSSLIAILFYIRLCSGVWEKARASPNRKLLTAKRGLKKKEARFRFRHFTSIQCNCGLVCATIVTNF